MIQRVFIAWSHSLFHDAVCRLLDSPGVLIVGSSQDIADAQVELDVLRPNTVIVEVPAGEASVYADVWATIQASAWNPRIICVSLHDNIAWAYFREQHTLEEAEDLLRLLLNA